MIIDFHVHGFPDELAVRAVPGLAEVGRIEARLDGTLTDIRASMKKAGVDKSVIQSIATKPSQTEKINDWCAEIQSDELIPFGSIHPDYNNWKSELERLMKLGIKGIKLHPDYQKFYVDDPKMYPFYDQATNMKFIILFHAGIDIGLKPPYHCTPERLLKVINSFPNGIFVAAHMGGYKYWDEVEELLVGKSVYLDTSMGIGKMSDSQAIRIINNHGPERIMFGTDSPWTDQTEEIAYIKGLGLGKAAEDAILGGNAERILGL
jgi:Predicted metal-dependent hydrolase of the TIM-barrel fold